MKTCSKVTHFLSRDLPVSFFEFFFLFWKKKGAKTLNPNPFYLALQRHCSRSSYSAAVPLVRFSSSSSPSPSRLAVPFFFFFFLPTFSVSFSSSSFSLSVFSFFPFSSIFQDFSRFSPIPPFPFSDFSATQFFFSFLPSFFSLLFFYYLSFFPPLSPFLVSFLGFFPLPLRLSRVTE